MARPRSTRLSPSLHIAAHLSGGAALDVPAGAAARTRLGARAAVSRDRDLRGLPPAGSSSSSSSSGISSSSSSSSSSGSAEIEISVAFRLQVGAAVVVVAVVVVAAAAAVVVALQLIVLLVLEAPLLLLLLRTVTAPLASSWSVRHPHLVISSSGSSGSF